MHDKDVQNKNQIKLLKLHYVLNDAISVCVCVCLYTATLRTFPLFNQSIQFIRQQRAKGHLQVAKYNVQKL